MTATKLRAFHNDPAIKEKYLFRVKAHAAKDHLIKGQGWSNGKGCAIGCTLEAYDHTRYPIELGLPEWLARLEDTIFENLPNDLAMTWPIRFLEAVNVGANIEKVRPMLAIRRLDRLIKLQELALTKNHPKKVKEVIQQVISAIQQVRAVHISEIDGVVDRSAVRSAESAVRSAAWSAESAESAAWSAAWSAESAAWSAAWSAESAAWSAESAAWSAVRSAESAARSAESAAWSAVRSAESAARSAESAARSAESAWVQESNDLIELLEATK
jgi:hypothetical protein